MWHGYIILTPVTLSGAQQTAIHNRLIQLGPDTADQPAYLMHYNASYTNDVYEALYDDSEITPAAFKTLTALALGVNENTLAVSETYSCTGIGISVRDATGERVRYILSGKQYSTWSESLARIHEGHDRVLSATTSYPMVGNESFNPATLNATAQTWRTRLLDQVMTALPSWADWDDADPAQGTVEIIWTTLIALISAFRITQDLTILDKIDVLAEHIWTSVNAGNWILMLDGIRATRISAIVNQLARVYQLNSGKVSPGGINYAARATQWATYVDTIHVPAVGTVGYALRHTTIAGIQGMYYNWIRTGRADSWYKTEAWGPVGFEPYRAMFQAPDGEALGVPNSERIGVYEVNYGGVPRQIWEHRIPEYWSTDSSLGPQAVNYAQYTMGGVIDMHLEGVWPWNGVGEITRWARSAEYVLAPGVNAYLGSIAEGAVHDEAWVAWRLLYWSIMGMGRWSTTVKNLGETVWALPERTTNVIIPSYMLLATV